MAKEETGGVWRTIGGRRVFIRDGQSLADAMKESGKFNTNKKNGEKTLADVRSYIDKQIEEGKNPIFNKKEKPLEEQYAEDLHNGKTNGTYKQWLDKKNGKTEFTKEELNNLERIGEKKVETNDDYEYNLYKQARENPDSINPMTENSTDWEDLDKKYKNRYEKEFKVSMGEVDIPDDFNAQFNDYVNARAKANAPEGEKMRQFIQDNNIRTFGDEIRENSNKEMIDAIKNDKMNYEDDGLGGTYSIGEYGKGTYIQFQDRKSYQHDDITKYPNATPKEKSYTWARVWQDGELVKDIEDSKYGARQKVIEYLENNNTASKKSTQNKDLEILNKHNLSGYDPDFKRAMLSRMESDNKYYLGNGGRNAQHSLWAKDVDEHIGIMKALYNTLPEKERPDWLTMKDIENYEKQMKSGGDTYDGTREYLKKNTKMTNAQINEYIRNLKNKK